MDFNLSTEELALKDDFRAYAERYFSRANVRQWQRDGGLPDDVCKAFINEYLGHASLLGDASGGGSLLAQVIATEEVSRVAGASLPFSSDIMNLRIMNKFAGSSKSMHDMLDTYRETGRLAFALAVSEPSAGSDTMAMRTTVSSQGDSYVLKGSKTFVANGEFAPFVMVAAVEPDVASDGYPTLSFWMVPRNSEGLNAYPIGKIGQKIVPFADIVFDDVRLEPSYRLRGEGKAGFPQLFHLLEIGRVMVCAQSLGMAQAAMEDAVSYARNRMAFGKNIASFQQIEQMLVDMEVKIVNMRSLVYRAAWAFDHDSSDKRLLVAMAKRYVPRAATEVASDALQVLGGRGYTENERVGSIWQDCRGNQIAEGTDQIMIHIAGPLLMESYDAS